MSEVAVEIPMDSLHKLPAGAVYSASKGQARVAVSHIEAKNRKPETIIVSASCDSLELECARYDKTVRSLKQKLDVLSAEQKTAEKNSSGSILIALKWLLIGAVIATAITITIIIIKKQKHE
jgi:hypothetical protein